MEFLETLKVKVKARHPVLWLVTTEEARVTRLLVELAREPVLTLAGAPPREPLVWSHSKGLARATLDEAGALKFEPVDPELLDAAGALASLEKRARADDATHGAPCLFVMRDLHRHLRDDAVGLVTYRALRDAAVALKTSASTLVVTSPVDDLPRELRDDVLVLDVPLPTPAELGRVLDAVLEPLIIAGKIARPDDATRERVLKAGRGLTEDQFAAALKEGLVVAKAADAGHVVRAKQQVLRKSGVLDYHETVEGLDDVGGLDRLKEWLQQRKRAFSDAAAKFGIRPPRGLFLTGPPGTGKSLTVKAAANAWGVPLLWVQSDRVFSKWVGESQQNLRGVFKVAEAVAPAILFFDEVEKFFAEDSSGVTAQVKGLLLSWMQEKKAPVAVFATANQPAAIPAELMARFDAVYFVDIPGVEEREAILRVHVRRLGRDPAKFDLARLARGLDGFSGREIEKQLNEALYAAFAEGVELSDIFLAEAFKGIQPLSRSRQADIEMMRQWANTFALPASAREARVARAAEPEL